MSNLYHRQYKDLFNPGIFKAQENIEWKIKYIDEMDAYFTNYDRSGTASYYNTLDINIFNMIMFYVGVGVLY